MCVAKCADDETIVDGVCCNKFFYNRTLQRNMIHRAMPEVTKLMTGTAVDRTCPYGLIYVHQTEQCVPMGEQSESECPDGLLFANGACVADCPPGFYADVIDGECV